MKIFHYIFLIILHISMKNVICQYERIIDSNSIPKLPLPVYDEDGNVEFFPRIIGGTPAVRGEFTGKVSMQTRTGFHVCGGTVVHLTHVVTAAHCVTDETGAVYHPIVFQLVADDLSIVPGSPLRQVRLVAAIFVHPEYNINTILNDIAVIRTMGPFLTTNSLLPVDRATFIPAIGTSCDVAGWGATVENGPASPILMRVQVNIIGTDVCNATESYNGFILPGMLCAGHMAGGRDACQGDSGGGLICNNLLSGVVSFGYGCGQPNFPGVYVDVSLYNNWINSAIFWHGPINLIPTPTTGIPWTSNGIRLITIDFILVMGLVTAFLTSI